VIEVTDVVIWAGEAEIDEGPAVDEFERLVAAGMPERMVIERMADWLDMSAGCLSIRRMSDLAILMVADH